MLPQEASTQGYLWMVEQTFLGKKYWTRKFFVLEDGLLSWYRHKTGARQGTLDLASRPCEVAAVLGSETQMILRARRSHWHGASMQVPFFRRPQIFLLAVDPTQRSRRGWLRQLRQHIRIAQSPSGSSVVSASSISEACPICFDLLDQDVVKTVCGHHFHHSCIGDWLKRVEACPVCRGPL
mmetsp:Transcript_67523/g.170374  ORF Transcript_67523/g.170374 Transcript_67523/m.170374 type:complete len:181 (+) Transcript_67523:84-626(+)